VQLPGVSGNTRLVCLVRLLGVTDQLSWYRTGSGSAANGPAGLI
jgi:hypothetical protein